MAKHITHTYKVGKKYMFTEDQKNTYPKFHEIVIEDKEKVLAVLSRDNVDAVALENFVHFDVFESYLYYPYLYYILSMSAEGKVEESGIIGRINLKTKEHICINFNDYGVFWYEVIEGGIITDGENGYQIVEFETNKIYNPSITPTVLGPHEIYFGGYNSFKWSWDQHWYTFESEIQTKIANGVLSWFDVDYGLQYLHQFGNNILYIFDPTNKKFTIEQIYYSQPISSIVKFLEKKDIGTNMNTNHEIRIKYLDWFYKNGLLLDCDSELLNLTEYTEYKTKKSEELHEIITDKLENNFENKTWTEMLRFLLTTIKQTD